MSRILLFFAPLALLALIAPAAAQIQCGMPGVTASANPPIAAIGQPVQVTLTNNTNQTIQLPDSCTFNSVHAGPNCAGPPVFAPFCLQVITPIPPGGSATTPWDQKNNNGQQVPNGTYSFDISYFDTAFNSFSCCVQLLIGCGTFSTYGTGCPTSAGVIPSLAGGGCPAPGGTIQISGGGGPPNAPGLLAFGLGMGPIPLNPACVAEIAPFSGALLPVALDGTGSFNLSSVVPLTFASGSITMQLIAIDLGLAPFFLAVSNGLEMTVP